MVLQVRIAGAMRRARNADQVVKPATGRSPIVCSRRCTISS